MKQSRAARSAWVIPAWMFVLALFLSAFVIASASFVLETEKQVELLSTLAIVVICLTPQFRQKLRTKSSIFFYLISAYLVYAGLSTLYGYAPKLALSEYSRLLAAYAVFLAAYSFTAPETMPQTVSVLCGGITFLSVIHLDAASWGIFGHKLMGLFQALTGGYLPDEAGLITYGYNTSANRLSGLFGNSNTMACMCAIGIFLGVYLLVRFEGFKRIWPCAVLIINSVTFLLSVSLGATASLGLTILLIIFFLHGAKNRLAFIFIVLETFVVAGVVSVLSRPHLGTPTGTGGFLVWVFCLLGIGLLFLVDRLVRTRLVDALCRHIKTLCIGSAVLLVLMVCATIIAFTQTTPVILEGNTVLYKRFPASSGNCEITLQVEGSTHLRINSSTQREILLETSTVLWEDTYDGVVTVELPEDVVELQLFIWPEDYGTITVTDISYVNGENQGCLAAGYRWIPDEVLQRLQSLTTNHSAMQRFVFMKDGLKLWMQSPIFGRGLGGFENGITSVQNFFYETKYAHNHYIQLLSDLGIVGLAIFVAILVFGFKGIWWLRRKEDTMGLMAALMGVLLMFAIHGAIELSPSVAEVSIFTFGSFGLIASIALPLPIKEDSKGTVAWCTSLGIAFLFGIYTVLLMFNAQASTSAATGNATFDQMEHYANTDFFEGDDYRLTYMVNGATYDDPAVQEQALKFANQLQKGHSNSVGPYLTNYYLQQGMYEEAAAASEKYLSYTKSVAENWNTQFQVFASFLESNLDNADTCEILTQLILDTYEKFLEVNQQQMDDLPLTAANASYLTQLLSTEGDLKTRMNTLFFDSSIAPDTNADGQPDAITVLSGEMQWDNGQYTALTDATIQLELAPTRPGTYAMEMTIDSLAGLHISVTDHEVESVQTETGLSIRWNVAIAEVYQPIYVQISLPQGSTVQQSNVKMIDGAYLN